MPQGPLRPALRPGNETNETLVTSNEDDNHGFVIKIATQFPYHRNRSSRFEKSAVQDARETPVLISHRMTSRMNVFTDVNKIVLVNRELLWLPRDQVRVLKSDVNVNIPDGYFGLLIGHINDDQCGCSSILIDNEGEVEIYLINMTEEPKMIVPGNLICEVYVLPCYVPETWETMNLSAPDRAVFQLKTFNELTLNPRSYTVECFDYMFMCRDELKALVIASPEMIRLGLIVETVVWTKCLPLQLKIFNASKKRLTIPGGTCFAHIIFTTGHFVRHMVPRRAVNQISVLNSISNLWFTYTTTD